MIKVVLNLLFLIIFASCDHYIQLPIKKNINDIALHEPVINILSGFVPFGTVLDIKTNYTNEIIFITLDGSDPSTTNYYYVGNNFLYTICERVEIKVVAWNKFKYSKIQKLVYDIQGDNQ